MDQEDIERRIRKRARHLWEEAGKPRSGIDAFLDNARTLIAIEDNPHAATKPNPITHPPNIGPTGEPIEPIEAVENEGEFPTLTDQGEEHTYPSRDNLKD